ncbi:probable plastid-lipid-associated protein 12, chloroplastic [Aristolochia californica]|uniref:probable plastid-lipid-associated protein 12, chloroplastic n=1 Tax=Aristolochia californica TaxID=171875 RepID=UPI0035DEF216
MAIEAAKLGFPCGFLNHTMSPRSSDQLRLKVVFESNCRKLVCCRISSSLVDEQQQLSVTEPEAVLIEGLIGIQGRGRSASPQQLKDVERAIRVLEDLQAVPDPTSSSLVEGSWQLMFTTRPGTASPIQRTFVGVDKFSVFQEVYLKTDDPRVTNVVKFSDAVGELRVEAAATVKDGKRILFQFDRAAFSFNFLPFKVPYPVPFRLLGDEAKGWLDITYLSTSGNIRISRGNKGTTFVLQKRTEPRQRLLSAISTGTGITEVIDELISLNQTEVNGEAEILGDWQLLWSSQTEAEIWFDLVSYGLEGSQVLNKYKQVENMVNILPGIKIRAIGNFETSGSNMYSVTMDFVSILFGIFELPVETTIRRSNLEVLYLDSKIRITRGFRNLLFVHLRIEGSKK